VSANSLVVTPHCGSAAGKKKPERGASGWESFRQRVLTRSGDDKRNKQVWDTAGFKKFRPAAKIFLLGPQADAEPAATAQSGL